MKVAENPDHDLEAETGTYKSSPHFIWNTVVTFLSACIENRFTRIGNLRVRYQDARNIEAA